VASNSGTGGAAEAGDDVNHTGREASLDDQLRGVQTGQRGLFSGLENNGVTGGDGGADLPGPHEEREVPGDDLTANTDGLVTRV